MKEKMSFKKIFAYSVGAIGDAAGYNFVVSFFSFYMTTVQGVSPAITGTVTMIAILWDAITDPIVGVLLDKSNKKEKRRSFIGLSVLPLALSIVMMFANANFMGDFKVVYYLLSVMLFWTAYTVFNIPYYSLGGTLTYDDDERTKLSSYRSMTGFLGIIAGTSLPTFLVGFFKNYGINEETSWLYAAIAVSAIALLTIFIMWVLLKGEEHSDIEVSEISNEKLTAKGVITDIKELLQNRSYFLIIISALCFNIFLTLFNGVLMYYSTFVLEATEAQSALIFTIMNIWAIVVIPFITKAALVKDKKVVYVATLFFSGLVLILGFFIPMNYPLTIALVILANIGTAAYWMFIFNLVYDVVDIDEFKHNKKRDGIIVSLYSFLLKAGGAITSQILGFMLVWSGFNADVATQTDLALTVIKALFTLLPGIFMFLSGFMIFRSPATSERLDKLKEALARRKEGKEYSTEGFEELL